MKKNILFFTLLCCSLWAYSQTDIEPIKTIKTGKNHELLLNGKPFFMISSWAQPVRNYPLLKELGFNTHSGDVDPAVAKKYGAYVCTTGAQIAKAPADNVLGIEYDDEPDLLSGKGEAAKPRQTPRQVTERVRELRAKYPGQLIFIGFTGNFTKEQSSLPDEIRKKVYPEYVKNGDVVSFDIYPIYGSGYASHLNWVGSGVAQLIAMGGDRPVTTAIETSKGSKWMAYEKQPDVLPIHTRNEVWQAIINGVTGITYFTHAWRPEFREFAPTPEMQQEMKRLNAQITRLAPAILAAPVKQKITMKMEQDLKCSFKATRYKGYVYIFAESNDLGPNADQLKQFDPISPRKGLARFTVPGLKAGKEIEVIDEQRSITSEKGSFSDEFNPLAEHIYRINL